MPEPSAHRELAAHARLTAHVLACGRNIDIASLAFTAAAIVGALWLDGSLVVARLMLLLSVIAGLAQKFFALRVALDRAIFADWAGRWETNNAMPPASDLTALDAALAASGLRRQEGVGERSLDERMRGAMKLLTYQAGLFIIQSLAILAAIVCRHGS